jgi:hypothetical protein
MDAHSETSNRRVVPRWRSYHDALRSGELSWSDTRSAGQLAGEEFMNERVVAWRDTRALPFAIDLVCSAHVLGAVGAAREAAEFILENQANVASSAVLLARLALEDDGYIPPPNNTGQNRFQIREIVAQQKQRRVSEPRNAFVWTDLARLYVQLGQRVPAERAIRIALSLAPSERFTIRSAVRFHLHNKDPEQALHLLRRNARTQLDPWLMAAEIAVSSVLDKTPDCARLGHKMVLSGGVEPFHTTELSSALATLELFSGNTKRANRLFELSLRQATDNSLAQAVWASGNVGIGIIRPELLGPTAHEALSFDAIYGGRWEEVVVQSNLWMRDESFSARPRLIASSIASSLLDEPVRAEQIARDGLATNPGHPALINNIAFALLEQNRPQDAVAALASIDRSLVTSVDTICLKATLGMAQFRLGDSLSGERSYQEAIHEAGRSKKAQLAVLAKLYLGSERIRARDYSRLSEFRAAQDLAKGFPRTTIPAIAARLAGLISKLPPA